MQIADLRRVVLVVFAPDLVRKQNSRKRLAQDNFTTDGRVCFFFFDRGFLKFQTFRFDSRQIHLGHVIRKGVSSSDALLKSCVAHSVLITPKSHRTTDTVIGLDLDADIGGLTSRSSR